MGIKYLNTSGWTHWTELLRHFYTLFLSMQIFNGRFACSKEYRESAHKVKCFKVLRYMAVGGQLSDDE